MENVASMSKDAKETISKELGIEPILINSALVSAQQRKRLYWTNIPNIQQPKDLNIYLKDIIESGDIDRLKSYCIGANYYKGTNLEKAKRQIVFCNNDSEIINIKKGTSGKSWMYEQQTYSYSSPKTRTLKAGGGSGNIPKIATDYKIRKLTPTECERLQTFPDDYTNGISNTQRYKCLGNSFTVKVIEYILKKGAFNERI